MSIAQQNPSPETFQKTPVTARRNGRSAGFRYLLRARMLELAREREVAFWIFVFPLLLALGLGFAFRNKPADKTTIAIVAGPEARNVLSLVQNSPEHASIHVEIVDEARAKDGLRLGKYDLLVEPLAPGQVQYDFDPARPESVLSHAEVDQALQSAAGRKDVVATRTFTSSEPGSRYIDFLIPGLLGMNLMNSGMWGIGFALVDMRQRKLLKRFVATPLRRGDFLLALASSRLILMVIEVCLLLGFGVLMFHIRVMGALLSILLIGAVGAIAFGGLGLLTASRARKIESVSGLINLVMMPMWIFSGVFFSYERFPGAVQPFIKALPLTALNDALRATILEGSTLASQSGRLLVLGLWGGISFFLALRWFRWT
ncbi:MAG TPA: ABC transporter permease [Terriglobales bacterium]|nr:ABC transporter permease [Terriglobales bacterium]